MIDLQFVLNLLQGDAQKTVVIQGTNEIADNLLFMVREVEETNLLLQLVVEGLRLLRDGFGVGKSCRGEISSARCRRIRSM